MADARERGKWKRETRHTKKNKRDRKKNKNTFSVVVAAGDDLLAGGAEEDGVFELGSVGASLVHQRRMRSHQPRLPKLSEKKKKKAGEKNETRVTLTSWVREASKGATPSRARYRLQNARVE